MNDQIHALLRAYPAIYMACHVAHRTRGGRPDALTSRDAGLLAHVEPGGIGPARLARHLGVGASTLSAALARLAAAGFIRIEPDRDDQRRRRVYLTEAGNEAVAEASVLEPGRVAAMLALLGDEDRARAIQGIELLAAAAKRMRETGECG
jgi:DNA-binding MarR family transcriptional regulator